MNSDYQIVERAIHYIAEHSEDQPDLPEIAAHAGASMHHFQRVFSRWAGISPKRMLQHLTALEAGDLLRRRMPVLETSLSVGLSSTSRLHDLFVTVHAMSPAAYREHGHELVIDWGVSDSPFGLALVASTGAGVCWLSFHDPETLPGGIDEMREEWSRARLRRDDLKIAELAPMLFGTGAGNAPVHVMVKGSNFQLRVWRALLEVPAGATTTYGDISRLIDAPRAGRAVGSAVGANRVALADSLPPGHSRHRDDRRLSLGNGQKAYDAVPRVPAGAAAGKRSGIVRAHAVNGGPGQ
ncbi:MAG: methylated-DNA--[protein]-cysteine S-methyltransferase [Gammaproteobacteria bacterium]|nr:methylated-DNA--[protein]-cysteine S-methyltransferase [Gammaproteobacteria bacterium]